MCLVAPFHCILGLAHHVMLQTVLPIFFSLLSLPLPGKHLKLHSVDLSYHKMHNRITEFTLPNCKSRSVRLPHQENHTVVAPLFSTYGRPAIFWLFSYGNQRFGW